MLHLRYAFRDSLRPYLVEPVHLYAVTYHSPMPQGRISQADTAWFLLELPLAYEVYLGSPFLPLYLCSPFMSQVPIHDTPILGMAARPKLSKAIEYGNPANFWVEYPSGLMDLTRSQHLTTDAVEPSLASSTQLDIPVNGDRIIRVDKSKTAAVIIDMQK